LRFQGILNNFPPYLQQEKGMFDKVKLYILHRNYYKLCYKEINNENKSKG
jgi:hypothetical protein